MSSSMSGTIGTIIAIVFALTVIFVRVKASNQPTNARKIIIPPLGMSTGFLMFVAPETHFPWLYALIALLCGFILSYPLIVTSQMYRSENGHIYLKRSKSFIVILLVLLVIRVVLHSYVERYVSLVQTGAIFFVLAFGMLLPWRIGMYLRYRRLVRVRESNKVVVS